MTTPLRRRRSPREAQPDPAVLNKLPQCVQFVHPVHGVQPSMRDTDVRQEQLLRAASAVITRQGYDKTTIADIAAEAGVSRGTVYLYFTGKEELFEALLYWEWTQYAQTWIDAIESDPRGGTMGGYYRAVIHAINSRPCSPRCCGGIDA